jgi:hypothetical protein
MAGGKASNASSLRPRADFEEIEAAVMETARGRWFLAEYARRHRAADTAAVLEALARLEARLIAGPERARTEPPVVSTPALAQPEPKPEPPVPQPMADGDDLKAMAEELLRGSRLFDWVGTSESEAEEERQPKPWTQKAEPAPAAVETAGPNEREFGDEEAEDEVEDEEIASWEAELTERSTPQPPPRSAALPPTWKAPPLRSKPPPPTAEAFPDLPEIAAKPVERPRLIERLSELRQPLAGARTPVSFSESKPLPPGPRVDDPTLTLTRDEKLALFS